MSLTRHLLSLETHLCLCTKFLIIAGGSSLIYIKSLSNTLEQKCPYNKGYYVGCWEYLEGTDWIATNDVHIKCANEDDFCTSENPCGSDQGDCDTHIDCLEHLFCGSNNCPVSLGFNSQFDCCYPVSYTHLTLPTILLV